MRVDEKRDQWIYIICIYHAYIIDNTLVQEKFYVVVFLNTKSIRVSCYNNVMLIQLRFNILIHVNVINRTHRMHATAFG